MQSEAWRNLIALVPEKQHNKLVFMTSVGVEISVQDVVRMQPDYVVVRGRLSGTNDTGRLYFVPYDQISYVGIAKLMAEAEIEEIFTGSAPGWELSAAAATEKAAEEKAEAEEAVKQPEPESEPEEALATTTNKIALTPTKFPNRAELLERIRQRSFPTPPAPKPK